MAASSLRATGRVDIVNGRKPEPTLPHAVRATTLLLVALATAACSIEHRVSDDYGQFLANNVGSSSLPKADIRAEYRLTNRTLNHRFEFRSGMAGYANLWIVELGPILSETLRSSDIQQAFGTLPPANATADEARDVLTFDLTGYSFVEQRAHVGLTVTLSRAGTSIFEKAYLADGNPQGAKMFWTGEFGMKNAVQQSTKLALDSIFRSLINDLNAVAR
jgi:hypothetical protein